MGLNVQSVDCHKALDYLSELISIKKIFVQNVRKEILFSRSPLRKLRNLFIKLIRSFVGRNLHLLFTIFHGCLHFETNDNINESDSINIYVYLIKFSHVSYNVCYWRRQIVTSTGGYLFYRNQRSHRH